MGSGQSSAQNIENDEIKQEFENQTPEKENPYMNASNSNSVSHLRASTVLKIQLNMAESRHDSRVNSKAVQSKLNSLPISQAKMNKNMNVQEEEQYNSSLKAKFIGEKVNGKPNGYGKLYFENKDFLEGTFTDGICTGKGRYIKADGSYYEGDIVNNEADGHGKFQGVDGFKYEGQWKCNEPNGLGEAMYVNGDKYRGQFLNGKRYGQGIFICEEGTYEGSFKNDKISGFCKFQGKDGEKYQGEWEKGMKNGEGTYKWVDGTTYRGSYIEDKRQGYGVMDYKGQEKYSGEWRGGVKHGEGTYESANKKIRGFWQEGKLKKVIEQ